MDGPRSSRFSRWSLRCEIAASVLAVSAWIAAPVSAQRSFEWFRLPPESLGSHAATFDNAAGVVLVHGGLDRGRERADLWSWDGLRWTRLSAAGAPPVASHAIAFDAARGRTILFGGRNANGSNGETWEWNGLQWRQLQPAASPPPRHGHAMVFDLRRQRIVLFGGKNGAVRYADTWEWDGASWTQANSGQSPSPRDGHAMAWHAGDARVVLFGGETASGRSAELFSYDGTSWTLVNSSGITARSGVALAFDPISSGLLLYGGTDGTKELGDCQIWDGARWFQVAAPVSTPSSGRTATTDGRRSMVALIGWQTRAESEPEIHQWNGSTWKPPSQPAWLRPPARLHPAMAWHEARGEAILFGGMPGDKEVLGDTWRWRGSGWEQVNPTTSPSPRRSMAMAADPTTRALVMFGGFESTSTWSTCHADTWLWDGSKWNQASSSIAPTPREQSMLAAEPSSGRPILFGGKCGLGAYSNETWAWAATGWVKLSTITAPPIRADGALVADPVRQRIVLFGGGTSGDNSGDLADTWEWDGVGWRQAAAIAKPSARRHVAGAFDPRFPGVLIHAGTSSMADTWVWDGSTWTPVRTGQVPDRFGRIGVGLLYDPLRQRMLRFGGRDDEQRIHDDTWELVESAPKPLQAHFPYGFLAVEGNTALSVPFAVQQSRVQFVLMARAFEGRAIGNVTAVDFRRDAGPLPQAARQIDVDMWLGPTSTAASRMSVTFAENFAGSPTRIHSGRLALPGNPPTQPGPAPFTIRVPASLAPFFWNAGDLTVEIVAQNNSNPGLGSYEIDAVSSARQQGTATPFGSGCSGRSGTPLLHVFVPGYLHAGGLLVTQATGIVPQTLSLAFLGTSRTEWSGLPLPFRWPQSNCTLYTGAEQMQWTVADALGTATSIWLLPSDPALSGAIRYLQWAAAEPFSGYPPFTLSQASEIRFAQQAADFDTVANTTLVPFGLKDPAAHVGPVLRLIVQ